MIHLRYACERCKEPGVMEQTAICYRCERSICPNCGSRIRAGRTRVEVTVCDPQCIEEPKDGECPPWLEERLGGGAR